MPVHIDSAANHGRVLTEPPAPVGMTQEGDGASLLVFRLREAAAQDRIHTQRLKQTCRQPRPRDTLRRDGTREVEFHVRESTDRREQFPLAGQDEVIRGTEPGVRTPKFLVQQHKPVRLAIRKALQKHPVDHVEDRGGSADAESQSQHHD